MKIILENFDKISDSVFVDELFVMEPDFTDDGFAALSDFYREFSQDTERREDDLQHKLCKGVITTEELEELEAIAVIKYPGLRLEEVSNFYIYSDLEKRKQLVFTKLNETVEL